MDRAEIFGIWDKIRKGIVIGAVAAMVAFAAGAVTTSAASPSGRAHRRGLIRRA